MPLTLFSLPPSLVLSPPTPPPPPPPSTPSPYLCLSLTLAAPVPLMFFVLFLVSLSLDVFPLVLGSPCLFLECRLSPLDSYYCACEGRQDGVCDLGGEERGGGEGSRREGASRDGRGVFLNGGATEGGKPSFFVLSVIITRPHALIAPLSLCPTLFCPSLLSPPSKAQPRPMLTFTHSLKIQRNRPGRVSLVRL